MRNITDTQRLVLRAAAERPNRAIFPLPPHLRGGTVTKVVEGLLKCGLAEHAPAAVDNTDPDEPPTGGERLVATAAALRALGLEPEASVDGLDRGAAPEGPRLRPRVRQGTKQAVVIAMLEGGEGATIEEIMATTGWQAHTARGFLSGALRKRLGLAVQSVKVDGRGRVYRIAC